MRHTHELDDRVARLDRVLERRAIERIADLHLAAGRQPALGAGADERADGVAAREQHGDQPAADVARAASDEDGAHALLARPLSAPARAGRRRPSTRILSLSSSSSVVASSPPSLRRQHEAAVLSDAGEGRRRRRRRRRSRAGRAALVLAFHHARDVGRRDAVGVLAVGHDEQMASGEAGGVEGPLARRSSRHQSACRRAVFIASSARRAAAGSGAPAG